MKLAIMQPYVFPYLGYFQLIHASDKFVFYDDVNFIKKGWVNRNRILINGEASMFSIPLQKASQNKKINEISVSLDQKWKLKLLQSLSMAYAKAPYFEPVVSLINSVVGAEVDAISDLAINSVKSICNYIQLEREIVVASRLYSNSELKRADRLIDICHQEDASHYVNAQGGAEIYEKSYFKSKGVELSFLECSPKPYVQLGQAFVPYLSIIDLLMFNSPDQVLKMVSGDYCEV